MGSMKTQQSDQGILETWVWWKGSALLNSLDQGLGAPSPARGYFHHSELHTAPRTLPTPGPPVLGTTRTGLVVPPSVCTHQLLSRDGQALALSPGLLSLVRRRKEGDQVGRRVRALWGKAGWSGPGRARGVRGQVGRRGARQGAGSRAPDLRGPRGAG